MFVVGIYQGIHVLPVGFDELSDHLLLGLLKAVQLAVIFFMHGLGRLLKLSFEQLYLIPVAGLELLDSVGLFQQLDLFLHALFYQAELQLLFL
jgi:hypothetical protein